jgi:endoglucanase
MYTLSGLDAVTTSGTYTIAIHGPVVASSPSFAIDLAANLYAVPLANSLYFYQNERDGANFIGTQLRTAGGHLNVSGQRLSDAKRQQ